jgi:hypothetical protein
MRSGFVAEWILTRFTTRSRAASIVGDLLESRSEKGTLWFWRSVAGIVLAVAWRRPLAFAAAFYLGLCSLGALSMPIYGAHAAHRPPEAWIPVFAILAWTGTLLWMTVPYAVIRFGLRDSFAQIALVFGGLVTIIIFYWWVPAVLVACLVLAFSLITTLISVARRWRALVALALATAFGFGGGLLALSLAGLYQKHLYPGPVAEINSRLINWGVPLLATWILATACSRMHRLLLRRDLGDPEADLRIKLDS